MLLETVGGGGRGVISSVTMQNSVLKEI